MNKREQMKQAIAGAKAKPKVAAAATPPKPPPKLSTKPKRSAAARDARAKARGRLPVRTAVGAEWTGEKWAGWMKVYWGNGNVMHHIVHEADGLFRLLEEMDVRMWDWIADAANADRVAALVFNPDAPDPEKS